MDRRGVEPRKPKRQLLVRDQRPAHNTSIITKTLLLISKVKIKYIYMAISLQEIEHIAELARLDLTQAEKEKFAPQLEAILKHIDQLNEVDTSGVEITAQVSDLSDIWRADNVLEWNAEEVQNALNQGEREAGKIKVKRVL